MSKLKTSYEQTAFVSDFRNDNFYSCQVKFKIMQHKQMQKLIQINRLQFDVAKPVFSIRHSVGFVRNIKHSRRFLSFIIISCVGSNNIQFHFLTSLKNFVFSFSYFFFIIFCYGLCDSLLPLQYDYQLSQPWLLHYRLSFWYLANYAFWQPAARYCFHISNQYDQFGSIPLL